MNLICRWFGHKWKQEGEYSNVSNPRYVCERCPATAAGVIIGGQEYDANPFINIKIMQREIKVETEEER